MVKILYIKPADNSFMVNDEKLLRKHFQVASFTTNAKNAGLHFLWRMIRLKFFILSHTFNTRLIILWFGDYHAALAVIMGKILRMKVVIIAGGQEAVCYPDLKKGVYYKKFRGRCVKFALRHADLILPNHESLIYHENFYYDPSGKKDGMKYYVPGLKTKIMIVPNGIETGRFYRDPSIPKDPNTVLTVGTMNSVYDFINKGFDLFIALARRNPDLKFVMAGVKKQFLPWIEANHPFRDATNLTVVYSFCPHEVLFENYNRAQVFVQASITEGMPNTLCEAMLCECIPVGSDVNGIPDAIGTTGIIVKKRDVAELEACVRKALLLNSGGAASMRIRQNFSFVEREKKMIGALQDTFFPGMNI